MEKSYKTTGEGKCKYLAPEVTILDIAVEAGFATSTERMPEGDEQNPWNA